MLPSSWTCCGHVSTILSAHVPLSEGPGVSVSPSQHLALTMKTGLDSGLGSPRVPTGRVREAASVIPEDLLRMWEQGR